jgi:hypothetical protein
LKPLQRAQQLSVIETGVVWDPSRLWTRKAHNALMKFGLAVMNAFGRLGARLLVVRRRRTMQIYSIVKDPRRSRRVIEEKSRRLRLSVFGTGVVWNLGISRASDRLAAATGAILGEKRLLNSSIQDGKKRFGSLSIVFMGIGGNTGCDRRFGTVRYCRPEGRALGAARDGAGHGPTPLQLSPVSATESPTAPFLTPSGRNPHYSGTRRTPPGSRNPNPRRSAQVVEPFGPHKTWSRRVAHHSISRRRRSGCHYIGAPRAARQNRSRQY